MSSRLTTLQNELTNYLSSLDFFATEPVIPIISENRKDVVNEIERNVGKLGICVIISTPLARAGQKAVPHFERIEVNASIIENVIVNRSSAGSGQPAALVAEAVAYYLTGYSNNTFGNKMLLDSLVPIELDQFIAFNVVFFTGGGITEPERL